MCRRTDSELSGHARDVPSTWNDDDDVALPFVANFAAGAIAGISEILTFYPLGELRVV